MHDSNGKLPRPLLLAGAFALLAMASVITAYLLNFNSELSDNHTRWAEFGDFLGGTLNATFGLISILAVLYTIWQQQQDLQAVRIESQRKDLLQIINKIQQDFDDVCQLEVNCPPHMTRDDHGLLPESVPLRSALFSDWVDWEFGLCEKPWWDNYDSRVVDGHGLVMDRETLTRAGSTLEQLWLYLDEYEQIGSASKTCHYLRSKYEVPRNRLIQAKIISEKE